MNRPLHHFLAALCALSLMAGCGRSGPESAAVKIPPRMLIEPASDHALWLPLPGIPSGWKPESFPEIPEKEPLRPSAEAARQRGLAAAQASDWKAAIAAFEEAQQAAHATPNIAYNLALAYERAGILVPAAMWYRVYLAEEPVAKNTAEVRAETERLIAEIESRAQNLMDEAERLAGALSDVPPAAGTRSLRQSALEDIANYAYMGGMEERGDRMSRAAQALPGADAVEEKRTYWDRHGLYAAAWAWDDKRVDAILARHPRDYPVDEQESYRGFTLGARGDQAALLSLMDRYPLWHPPESLGVRALPTRSYEVIERMALRKLSPDAEFDTDWFRNNVMSAAQSPFWDGRPDIGIRISAAALAHLRTPEMDEALFGYHRMYTLLLLAITGDVPAIRDSLKRPPMLPPDDENLLAGEIALTLLATTTPAETIEVIDLMMENIFRDWTVKLEPSSIETRLYPMAYVVRRLAAGELDQAVALLDSVADRADHQAMVRRLLMYAVSTGKYMALSFAERLKDSSCVLLHLNRLGQMPNVDNDIIVDIATFAKSISSGWRPWDGKQSRRVWTCIEHARFMNPKEYDLFPENMEEIVEKAPEKIPVLLAAHALIQWMGALAARREETVYGRDGYFGTPDLLGD